MFAPNDILIVIVLIIISLYLLHTGITGLMGKKKLIIYSRGREPYGLGGSLALIAQVGLILVSLYILLTLYLNLIMEVIPSRYPHINVTNTSPQPLPSKN